MTAYYNENDPHAAEVLRQLIAIGAIADGVVDDRDVRDVKPDELRPFTQCHFFAGIGGWSLALREAGWPDDRRVWTGSCPCQPFSAAGRGDGYTDERHLWPYWGHLVEEREPTVVFGEQVASKAGRAWLDLVQTDLEALGYITAAADLCAAGVGAPHWRQRAWFVGLADTDDARLQGSERIGATGAEGSPCGHDTQCSTPNLLADTDRSGPTNGFWRDADWLHGQDGKWRPVKPGTFPLANGLPSRVGTLREYGNAIVPQVATEFIKTIMEILDND